MSQVVVFEVASERFGIPLEAVEGVARGAWPVRLPRPPFGCIGAVDVRGEVIPLLDMGALLGLRRTLRPEAWAERLYPSHFLILRAGGQPLALLVDRVHDVMDETSHALVPAGENQPSALGSAQGEGDERWLVIDPETLVGKGRRRLLARAARQARGEGEGEGREARE